MPWDLNIRRIANGYIVSWNEEIDEFGNCMPQEEVIQDDEQDDLKSHEEALWRVMEYFNMCGSKHDKERLKIERIKQNES